MKKNVIIVGSGAGGATLAKEMAKNDFNIFIIEWGKNNKSDGGIFASPFRFFGGIKNKSKAFLKTVDKPHMEIIRAITTGGGTLAYGGISADPPFDLFEKHGIDIKKEVEEIKKEITIKPIENNQMGPAAQLINKSAVEIGLEWQRSDRLFYAPEKFKHASYLFGDKTGARWDAGMWIRDALKTGARLYNEVYCEKIIVDNGKAAGIIASMANGDKKEFLADIVIVAAGGIGSPEILGRSGIKSGSDIFVDPYIVATGYLGYNIMDIEVTRQAGVHLKEDGISLGDSALPPRAYKKLIFSNKKFDKLFKRKKSLSVLVEIGDDSGGAIDSGCKIKKPLSRNDLNKLNKGKEIAKKILENAGAKDIWFSSIAGVHPGGACKIGSVVDSNLETGIKNLYVCDASVLPESIAVPPVLTILALAKRLANHIAKL